MEHHFKVDAEDVTGQIVSGLLLNAFYSAQLLHVAQGGALTQETKESLFSGVVEQWNRMCELRKLSSPPL